jgi:hypothetical protein
MTTPKANPRYSLRLKRTKQKVMVQRETELYLPLKTFLTAQGFKVAGEVHSCDLVATRCEELVIVEMKRVFSLDLVFQSVQRQTLSNTVYLAFEEPRGRARKRWRQMLRLCRMLGLGMLTVRFEGRRKAGIQVVVALEPAPYKPRINSKKRKSLLREFANRSGDYNTGGCTRKKIVTAYREEALRLAWQLKLNGPSKVKALAESAQSSKAQSILYKNYYEWFEKTGRGMYQLTEAGGKALETYKEVLVPIVRATAGTPEPKPAVKVKPVAARAS